MVTHRLMYSFEREMSQQSTSEKLITHRNDCDDRSGQRGHRVIHNREHFSLLQVLYRMRSVFQIHTHDFECTNRVRSHWHGYRGGHRDHRIHRESRTMHDHGFLS